MKKLALELDGLRVESFATSPETGAPLGTVMGHARALGTTGCTLTRTQPVSDITCMSDCGSCGTADCTVAC
jgi:hypothetical protein